MFDEDMLALHYKPRAVWASVCTSNKIQFERKSFETTTTTTGIDSLKY